MTKNDRIGILLFWLGAIIVAGLMFATVGPLVTLAHIGGGAVLLGIALLN